MVSPLRARNEAFALWGIRGLWLANNLDGVFFGGARQAGAFEFRTLPPPTDDGVGDVRARIAARAQRPLRRWSSYMPLITVFNLRKEDRLADIDNALRRALVSMPELKINDDEIDFVPVSAPDGFHGQVTRINVDLWEGSHRTKEALQELAARAATAFQRVTGSDRKVKVVIRPYDVEGAGWVSL